MEELWKLWTDCVPDLSKVNSIAYCSTMILNKWIRYKTVGDKFGIPAYIVGVIHYRESSFNFATHLANGDPLFNSDGNPIATSDVPKGLGPFSTWEDGAAAAIVQKGFDHGHHWDLLNALDNLERWNGLGYREHEMPSPYLWSSSSNYKSGKYASDGIYDPKLVDQQIGCVPILLALKSQGVDLNEIAP